MSKLGKILLIIAAIGGVAAAVAGFLIIQKRADDKNRLETVQQEKAQAEKKALDTQTKLTASQTAQAAAEKKASDDDKQISDLSAQLTTAQKDATDAKAAVQTAKDSATAAQAKFDEVTALLGGKTPQQYKDDVAKAQADLTAAQSEQKILEDQLQASVENVKQMQVNINNANKHIEPPGVSGKVTFVDNTWNFVVLDVGLDAGVVPNGELIVYRGRTFLGKIRVTRADPKDAVAEILPDVKGHIQVGDAVLN